MILEPKDIDDDLFCYFENHGKPPKNWEQVAFFDEETDLAVVSVEGFYGAVNRKGEIVIPLEYDFAKSSFRYGFLIVKKGEKYGMIDKKNRIVIPFGYDEISCNNKNYIAVSKDNLLFGVINFENKEVLPFIYDDLKNIFDDNFICFGKKSDDDFKIYFEKELWHYFKDDKLLKYGIINIIGEEIVPPISYMPIHNFINNKAMCFDFQKNEFFIYDVVTKKRIFAPKDLIENKEKTSKVNYIRNLLGIEPVIYKFIL